MSKSEKSKFLSVRFEPYMDIYAIHRIYIYNITYDYTHTYIGYTMYHVCYLLGEMLFHGEKHAYVSKRLIFLGPLHVPK